MSKDDIIMFLYYLLDKVEDVYYKEAKQSIERFISKLKN